MKERKVDFHIHSSLSDGDLTPLEIAQLCSRLNVETFVITDHDSIGSASKLREFPELSYAQIITGVELDCIYKDVEIHLLGYDFDDDDDELNNHLSTIQQLRRRRVIEQIQYINSYYGKSILAESDIVNGQKETYMKPHVIHKLMENGFYSELPYEQAYQKINKWINDLVKTETTIVKPDIIEAIRLIKNAGGLSILAHPGYYPYKNINLETMFRELKHEGLEGVEVNYPYHYNSPDLFPSLKIEQEITENLEMLCEEHKFLKTSGSDSHTKTQLIYNNNHSRF